MLPMAQPPRTVLIVDDDPQMLVLIEKILKPMNVRVVVAPQAADALRISESQPIHLLISDVKLPNMDGVKLAGRVLKLHPQASVLLISGFFHSAPANAKQIRFLAKPFFPSELIRHLRELLPEAEA